MIAVVAAALDNQISVGVAILILTVVGVGTIIATAITLISMMNRQRRDLAHHRKIAGALIDLSVQLEHEERRSRHAIKNLCGTLTHLLQYWKELPLRPDFHAIAAELEVPLAEAASSGQLIHDLVTARERAGVQEEAVTD